MTGAQVGLIHIFKIMLLIHNKMMVDQEQKTKCTKCPDDTVPVKTVINCNALGCNYSMNDPSGIGQDRR